MSDTKKPDKITVFPAAIRPSNKTRPDASDKRPPVLNSSHFTDRPNDLTDRPNDFTDQSNDLTDPPDDFTYQSNDLTDPPHDLTDRPNNFTDPSNDLIGLRNAPPRRMPRTIPRRWWAVPTLLAFQLRRVRR